MRKREITCTDCAEGLGYDARAVPFECPQCGRNFAVVTVVPHSDSIGLEGAATRAHGSVLADMDARVFRELHEAMGEPLDPLAPPTPILGADSLTHP